MVKEHQRYEKQVVVPIFKGKGDVIDCMWDIQRSKAAGECNEDGGENAGEHIKRIGKDR